MPNMIMNFIPGLVRHFQYKHEKLMLSQHERNRTAKITPEKIKIFP